MKTLFKKQRTYNSETIKALRLRYDITQKELADALRTPVDTIRSWENGRYLPCGPSQRLLEILDKHPEVFTT